MAIEVSESDLQELEDIGSQLVSAVSREQLEIYYSGIFSDGHVGGPYDWQVRFHNGGIVYKERAIMAGNRVGKSRTAACEVALHATGLYPDWWEGKRFDKPTDGWIGSETNEASRDITQAALLGGLGEALGTGWIPGRLLHSQGPRMRQAGVSDVVDSIRVKHVSGGYSKIGFKTYDQGRKRWQGVPRDYIWLDEEPPEDIYTEALTRTLDTKGLILLTFTPLLGNSVVVRKYLAGGPHVMLVGATWDDAPHLEDKEKEQMLASYPEYERETRASGQPMLGQGAVFPFKDSDLSCDIIEIPGHWAQLVGIDFGINHPAAAIWIAHDRDTDTIYITDCYRKANEAAPYHAQQINRHGDWIPVAWPHDGLNREKSGGKTLADSYRDCRVNMLGESARYDEAGGAQPLEPVVMELYERMKTGRIKVFHHLSEWFEEKRFYHRDDRGKIVSSDDDLMAATRYAVMMKRYAMSKRQSDLFRAGPRQTDAANYDPLAAFTR